MKSSNRIGAPSASGVASSKVAARSTLVLTKGVERAGTGLTGLEKDGSVNELI